MGQSTFGRSLSGVLLGITTSGAVAAGGIYATEGNDYCVEVRFAPDTLILVEPNKTSVYQRQGADPLYYFRNPANGKEYMLEVLDDGIRLKAYTVKTPESFTLLKRIPTVAPGRTVANCAGLDRRSANDSR